MPKFKKAQIILSGKKMFIWFKTPNQFGVNLNDVVSKWHETTEEFSPRSLVAFINKAMPECAYTEEDFETMRNYKPPLIQ